LVYLHVGPPDEIQNDGRRHLEFIIFVHFGSMVYFRWQPATSPQNFIHLRQSAAELLLFVQKFKMAAAAILDLIFVQYFGIPACRTFCVICMPNFVQICATVNELWAIDEIQNGGRRHLEFIIFVHFGQMFYFRWQPTISLQNFIHLCHLAAELLMLVQKSKMAAAILNYNFVLPDHPRSPFVHLKFPLKFRVDRVRTFRDIVIRKFRKFGLKCLFRPSKNHVFGEFWPPNIILFKNIFNYRYLETSLLTFSKETTLEK